MKPGDPEALKPPGRFYWLWLPPDIGFHIKFHFAWGPHQITLHVWRLFMSWSRRG